MARKKAKALPKLEEIYTIWAEIIQETEDAILINCGESSEVWLPKSRIDYSGDRGSFRESRTDNDRIGQFHVKDSIHFCGCLYRSDLHIAIQFRSAAATICRCQRDT